MSGGIPGLANQFPREQILKFDYEDAPTLVNEAKTRPQLKFRENGREVSLPALHNVVRSLDQVVEVDYYVPGCPPTPKLTKAAIDALLEGKLPPKGSVLAPGHRPVRRVPAQDRPSRPTLASPSSSGRISCWRTRTSVSWRKASSAWDRRRAAVAEASAPPATCPAPAVSARPRGCATRVSKSCPPLCANVASKEEGEISKVLAGIPDPVGTFYRYGLAKSLLRRKVRSARPKAECDMKTDL